MPNRTKQLVRAAAALVVALVAKKAMQRAANDRTFRGKARAAGKALGDNLNRLARAAGERAPEIGREAARQIRRLSKTAAG